MAGKKEFVQLIRYQFSSANLFSNQSSPTSRYKTEESAQNYAGLCCKELQQLYPNAIVEVIPVGPELEEDQSNFVETYVETWSDGEQVPDLEEPQIVDELCRRIFEGFEWLVSRNRILVSQAPEFTEIPPSVLRWACNNDLVKGAEKSTGFWIFPLEQLPEVRKQLRFADHNEISGMLFTQEQTVVCYMEDVKEIFLFNLPQHIRFLVVLKQDFENSLLRPNNSLFLICRIGQNVQVELEHFIDVEKWPHSKWTYAAYTEALSSQSRKQKMEVIYQVVERNERREIDGFSLQLTKLLVSQETTVQVLLDSVLRTLLEVVNEAELFLAGGPTWDQIYEQDEKRFCKEVLEPLLNKMGFRSVRYIHGDDEYGRDFIFSEVTSFDELRHYGLQAKAGNISGGAGSGIDTIVAQIVDAFSMPYTKEPKARSEIYISTMIVAISGEFTRNAIEKVRIKIPAYLAGSVYFWDKPKIRSLIAQYWNKEKLNL